MQCPSSTASVRARRPQFLVQIVRVLAGMGLAVLGAASALAQMAHQHHRQAERGGCRDASLACASTVTPAFGPDASLWLAFTAADRVLVAHSADLARNFGTPVSVTPGPQQLDWGPDARPKIVVDRQGRVFVAYALFKDKAFNGQVYYAYSQDSGASFGPPRPITSDPESQRFEVLALDPSGALFAAWLDKRNRAPARARGESYTGAALAFAWLSGDNAEIGEAAIARDNTCECCRLGVDFAGPGRPVVLFRNVFGGGVRDHAVITFANPRTPGPPLRVSNDDWRTDACPHHGPSLSVGPNGTYHAAWFTNGRARQGLFYARSADGGRTFSEPMPVGAVDRQAARPSVLACARDTWLAWKELDGEDTVLLAMVSRDDGASWAAPREIARTGGDSDHPLLLANGDQVFVSWMTRREGYRFIPLEANL
jgi:hypothetical protein